MSFYDNFIKQCVAIDKKPSVVARELGLAKSAVSHWKSRGTVPRDAMKQKIADYFGCTIEALTAEAPAPHIKLPGNNIFDALQLFAEELPQEAKKPTVKDDELSEYDMEIMELLRLVPEERKPNVTAILKEHLRLSGLIE